MSISPSQLPNTKKAKKDRKSIKKAQDEANDVYDSLSNGQIDILSQYSNEHILGLRLSNYDRNLLHIAVWFNVEVLIDKICCNSALRSLVNDKDANGETPLHLCVFCQNVQAFQKLLTAGANLEITNNKGERALDTALDPVLWQNYLGQIQAGITPSVVKPEQIITKSEEIKNPQSPEQEQSEPVVIVQQPEIKKPEETKKPTENIPNKKPEETKKNEEKIKQIENNTVKPVEQMTLEVKPMDSKELPPSPNFGVVNKDVAKTSPKNIQPEISTPIPNKAQEQKNETKITPFVEKDPKKPLTDNKAPLILPEKDIPEKKNDDKNSVSQLEEEKKKKQDLVLPAKEVPVTNNQEKKENKITPVVQENNPQITPIVSTIPNNNQNKTATKTPVQQTIQDTPLSLVINPKTNGDTVPQPKKDTSPKEDPKKNIPTPQSQHSATHNTNPMSITTLPQKSLHDSLVNPIITPQETHKKPQNNNNDTSLIETFAKPQNKPSTPNKIETANPTKRNTTARTASTSKTHINSDNEQKPYDSPKKDIKKPSGNSIPDILDKTEKKAPALNIQPTPIKTQQKRDNSSSRLNGSALPSLQKESRAGSRGGSKTPFKTNAKEIIGTNNPTSLTFDTKSPTKVESKRDLSRNQSSSKSILDNSPIKRENSALINKRPGMGSYKSSGANLQLDISRKTKEDYKTDQGYNVGSRLDSSPLDSNSSPGLSFNMNSRGDLLNNRRRSNLHAHSKYTNETLKHLEQRNRSVGKADSNEVIFEYNGQSQAHLRTKTENNKDWDSIFDISMHTEGNANDKSFNSGRSPLRPGRMLYMNPTDGTYSLKTISPEKKERTLSPIRDKDPEYSFGKPLVPSQDKIFGRQKSPAGKREDSSGSPMRKGEMIYVENNDFNFTTQGSDVPLNANRRFKRDIWKGGNF